MRDPRAQHLLPRWAALVAAASFGASTAFASDLFVNASANCAVGNGSQGAPFCTINEALAAAVDGDVIRVAPGGYTEELSISLDVVLETTGTPGSVVLSGSGARNYLTVETGAVVMVDGFSLRNGNGFQTGQRGNVVNRGDLTLRNATIANSTVLGCCEGAVLYSEVGAGTMTLDGCTITNNYAGGTSASVVRSYGGGGLVIRNSSLVSNYVYAGPMVRTNGTPTLIEGCYFQSNRYQTAAVLQSTGADFTLRNTTISSTAATAAEFRGADGVVLVENSTLVNQGNLSATAIRAAAGAVPQVRGSILGYGGLAGNFSPPSVAGSFQSLGYNLVEDAGTSSGFVDGVLGDQVGTPGAPKDAMLAAPALNGGMTRSRLPLPGSPAIDAGHPTEFPASDQRGFPRTAGGADVGAVEVPAGTDVVCQANGNSTGFPAILSATGSSSLSRGAFDLYAANVPPGMTGIFLASRASGFVPGPGGSFGNLCLGGTIGRLIGPGQVQTASAEATMRLSLDLSALPQGNGTAAVLAGEQWFFQGWFRDSLLGFPTSNFTTATTATFTQ